MYLTTHYAVMLWMDSLRITVTENIFYKLQAVIVVLTNLKVFCNVTLGRPHDPTDTTQYFSQAILILS